MIKIDNVNVREITQHDISAVISCLARNFPRRNYRFWSQAVNSIIVYSQKFDFPHWGRLLESNNKVVGVLLTIYHRKNDKIFCNLSSWCVDPEYRGYATILARFATKDKTITYTNISAAPHTYNLIELLKFKRYAEGQMSVIPLLCQKKTSDKTRIIEFNINIFESKNLTNKDQQLLIDHKNLGMKALIGIIGNRHVPIILKWLPLWKYAVPTAHLIYCENQEDLLVFANEIGKYCLQHGRLRLLVSSNAKITGLFGRYQPNKKPLYFRGPEPPNPLDLSYTEFVLFI